MTHREISKALLPIPLLFALATCGRQEDPPVSAASRAETASANDPTSERAIEKAGGSRPCATYDNELAQLLWEQRQCFLQVGTQCVVDVLNGVGASLAGDVAPAIAQLAGAGIQCGAEVAICANANNSPAMANAVNKATCCRGQRPPTGGNRLLAGDNIPACTCSEELKPDGVPADTPDPEPRAVLVEYAPGAFQCRVYAACPPGQAAVERAGRAVGPAQYTGYPRKDYRCAVRSCVSFSGVGEWCGPTPAVQRYEVWNSGQFSTRLTENCGSWSGGKACVYQLLRDGAPIASSGGYWYSVATPTVAEGACPAPSIENACGERLEQIFELE